MKRRSFIQALAAAPAAPALLAQQGAQQPAQAPAPAEPVPLVFAASEEGADPILGFFNARQVATLKRVCDLLVPSVPGTPGAVEAHVPEFMDFLIGDSPSDRQQVWTRGLDALEAQSQSLFRKSFADTDAAQADTLFAPLRQPWTFEPPRDPVARLLAVAKLEIRTATVNSYERRRTGGGLYWLPVD